MTATVIVGDNIQRARLLVIKSGLRLEAVGMKCRISAAPIARAILVKAGVVKPARNKQRLLEQFTDYLNNGGLDAK
jgi:hypothetical protein